MKHKLSATALSNLYTMGVTSNVDPRQTIPSSYVIPDEATRKLRAQLILEEALETIEGLGFMLSIPQGEAPNSVKDFIFHAALKPNLEDIIDGCCDTIYVAVGTLCAVGAPDEEHMTLVNQANNAKFPNGVAVANENGKFQKPEGWTAPNHGALVGEWQRDGFEPNLRDISMELVDENQEMVECPACSKAGGADREVCHAPPVCPE